MFFSLIFFINSILISNSAWSQELYLKIIESQSQSELEQKLERHEKTLFLKKLCQAQLNSKNFPLACFKKVKLVSSKKERTTLLQKLEAFCFDLNLLKKLSFEDLFFLQKLSLSSNTCFKQLKKAIKIIKYRKKKLSLDSSFKEKENKF